MLHRAIGWDTSRIHKPSGRWRLIQGNASYRGATWSHLCGDITIDQARGLRERVGGQDRIGVAVWNARWLVDPHTAVARRKRDVINDLLRQKRVVLIQETHWDDGAAAVWQGACSPTPQ